MPPFLTAAEAPGAAGESLGDAGAWAGGLEEGLAAAEGEDPAVGDDPAEGPAPSLGESGLALLSEPGVATEAAWWCAAAEA